MKNSIKKIILRIIDISYKNKLSHIGSCINSAPIIYDIYEEKGEDDIFVLSCGHAYLAQLVVMEHFGVIKNAEEIVLRDGVHPKRNLENGVVVSTGSLGMGLSVSVGLALASTRKVYCLLSDGEMAEGSIWESLRFINNRELARNDKGLPNLHIYINVNGYSALGSVDISTLDKELKGFSRCQIKLHNTAAYIPLAMEFMQKLDAHYQVLNEKQYGQLKYCFRNL